MYFFLGMCLFTAKTFAQPVVSLAIDNNIQVNQAFNIEVLVSGVDPKNTVIAFGFAINYDSSWIQNSETVGPNFVNGDLSGVIAPIAAIATSTPPPSGDNILLDTLNFTASAPGSFSFSIATEASNQNEGLFLQSSGLNSEFDLNQTQVVSINAGAAVPLPSANLLFGFGLAGLGLIRSKLNSRYATATDNCG